MNRKQVFNAIVVFSIAAVSFAGLWLLIKKKEIPSEQREAAVRVRTEIEKNRDTIITDSKMTFDEAVSGIEIPARLKKNLLLVDVEYFSFDGKLHRGQLVVNKKIAEEVSELYREIKDIRFPIKSVIPIVKYNWQDNVSMDSNNSSAFNYRFVEGTKSLSAHAVGTAIDINPVQNPQIKKGKISPASSVYNSAAEGTITSNSPIVKIFKKRGWIWGGEWNSVKDYQHFEKKAKQEWISEVLKNTNERFN